MTVIEIRPFRNGWQVYESAGVQPVFLNQQDAIDYATGRACCRSGEIRVFGSAGICAKYFRLMFRCKMLVINQPLAFLIRSNKTEAGSSFGS